MAGGGRSLAHSGSEVPCFDPSTVRIPLEKGLLGKVVASGQQFYTEDFRPQMEEMPGFDWLIREHICGGGVIPINFHAEVLGVMITFTRDRLPTEAKSWGRVFANQVGAALANARAFEEIQRLKAQLEQQNAYLQEEVVEAKAFGDLVGQSAALRRLVSQIDLVAPTEASVLIQGDTGTGKELVAYEIHRRSRRKDKPLVRVNCAAISKDLFESEFFGHAKGAFTGAVKDRAGRFETAEGGTLFLDEIGEVPLDMQAKLLRVLQEKQYERVGEDRTRRADVRVVAATNRDLEQAAVAGRFRQDLFYRLNVFPIRVSALGERVDDIPLLARHFVELSVRELRCPPPRLTRAAVVALQNYHWPGNIRELRNVVERAVILARGGPLHFDLPVGNPKPAPAAAPSPLEDGPGPGILSDAEIQRLVRNNVLAALKQTNWKISGAGGAAELLGLKPTTLLSRIKKLGLTRSEP
jgi:transcriptional regulator with GAF, ATPase, and Fis domain